MSFYKGLEHPWILVSTRSFPQLNAEGQVSTLRACVYKEKEKTRMYCIVICIFFFIIGPLKTPIAAGHPSMNLLLRKTFEDDREKMVDSLEIKDIRKVMKV